MEWFRTPIIIIDVKSVEPQTWHREKLTAGLFVLRVLCGERIKTILADPGSPEVIIAGSRNELTALKHYEKI